MERQDMGPMVEKRLRNPSPALAKLENGNIVEYSLCSKTKETKFAEGKTYLGKGVIHLLNREEQEFDELLHFWGEKIKVSSDYQSVEDGILDGILKGCSIEYAKQRIWEASKNGSFDLEGAMQDFLEKSKGKS